MENKIKTILIGLIAIFGTGFLVMPGTFALANDSLFVQFERTPLFSETNFLPGESVSRWVKVTNNSGQVQRIAAEAINVKDPNRLGDVLNLEIKEGGIRLYNNALSKFFTEGEVYLSNLAGNGIQTQYDFIVTFYSGTGNPFQGKSLSFDILIGFQGEEGGILPGAGGGAGGFLPPGLTIQDESVRITGVGEISVIITWLTSYFSTSQVIYAKDGEKHTLDLTDNTGTPPKYGYERTTPEYNVSPKVTSHSVTISGLDSGTKYYYRAVSHASLAISQEYSFTTLGVEEVGEEVGPAFVPPGGETSAGKEEKEEGEKEKEEGSAEEVPVVEISLGEPASVPQGGVPAAEEELVEEGPIINLAGLLAAIGQIPFNVKVILLIVALILIVLIILWLFKKKRKIEKK